MPFNDPAWIPITDSRQLRVLGKLGEELGEASAATSRCIIQGLDGLNPKDGKINKEWLEEELTDVLVQLDYALSYFHLNRQSMQDRFIVKRTLMEEWVKKP